MTRSKRILPLGTTAVAALVIGLAAPADAEKIFAWRTDDGGYAFADDLRRVPERYRDRVQVRETASVREYAHFTPTDDAATDSYASQLAARVLELRRLNAALERELVSQRLARNAARGGGPISVRLSSEGEPIVDVPSAAGGAGGQPVVIEDVIARPEGDVRTRTNTVIRRGDEIIAIVRPFDAVPRVNAPTEEELEAGGGY